MDTERLLNYLFGAYMVVVLVVWRLGGGSSAFPEVYGLNSVNLGLVVALVVLLYAYIYQQLSET
ncbi:hypothetical protein [Halopelagius longus]|uniref:Uncharacterized protein n=1 Tax=Halopelagius longus TaxID=1236180 RepID=A0A1H1G4S6_9EURY|nr:hypothetical protein [Halopelagius longus]RDI69842.1 hypothetical protein DWB78_16970 [Halopelagius longus]SDR08252.1 hypothetical protein SAMN05216278_3523 [Halopelagius longus]